MRTLRLLARAAVTLTLLLAVLAALVVWRIARGPVSLDPLLPRLCAALSSDGDTVRIGRLLLAWNVPHRRLELRAQDFRLTQPDGTAFAFDDVALRLRARALLHGRIVVTAVELGAPTVELVRRAGGGLVGRAGGVSLAYLGRMMGHVQSIVVHEGRATVLDEASGVRWAATGLEAAAWREDGDERASLAAALQVEGRAVPVALTAHAHEGRLDARITTPGAPTVIALAAWPPALAADARRWFAGHVSEGGIHDVVVELRGHVDGEAIVRDAVTVTLGFDGFAVRGLDTMPPATGVRGRARLDQDGGVVDVAGGALEGLAVLPSTVTLRWKDPHPVTVDVDAHADGPLATALALADNLPVSLSSRLGIAPGGATGTMRGHVRVGGPLTGPRANKLRFEGTAAIRGASLPNVAGDWPVRDADAAVRVDGDGASIAGTAVVAGIPAKITGQDRFADPGATRLEVAARLDAAARARLGFDTDRIDGPVDAVLRVRRGAESRPVADVEIDLTPAAVSLPVLAVDKPRGEPGRVVARLGVARGVVASVDDARLVAGGAEAHASASRPPAGGPWSRIDADATLPPPPDGDVPGTLALAARSTGDAWTTTITAPDAGRVLRAWGRDVMRGGRATFAGTFVPAPEPARWHGTVTVEKAVVRRVPWLVRLLALTSLRPDRTVDSGVVFDRMTATLDVRRPTVEVSDLVASGPTLAIRLRGRADTATESLDLQGMLVPSYYLINSAPSRLPLVGGLLDRVTGGALQAFAFSVGGTMAEPSVRVDPIASLAPGVLRDWIRALGG